MYSTYGNYNITRDYNKLQGVTHPSDTSYQIIRDIGVRRVSVENSSEYPVGVAITTYVSGPTPNTLFTLARGEIKHIAINSQGGPPQFLWILGYETQQPSGAPTPFRTDANQFVLRQGTNKWWVQAFKQPSFNASH